MALPKADELHLTPLELIDRIAALVPPPRTHRHRYLGVLAPNSPLRAAVTALATPAQAAPVLGAVKRVGHRLVDGHGHGLGGRVGAVAGVDGQGFDAHGGVSPVVVRRRYCLPGAACWIDAFAMCLCEKCAVA